MRRRRSARCASPKRVQSSDGRKNGRKGKGFQKEIKCMSRRRSRALMLDTLTYIISYDISHGAWELKCLRVCEIPERHWNNYVIRWRSSCRCRKQVHDGESEWTTRSTAVEVPRKDSDSALEASNGGHETWDEMRHIPLSVMHPPAAGNLNLVHVEWK